MKNILKNCIDGLKVKGAEYADCRFVRIESEALKVTNGRVDQFSRNLDVGVGVRVLLNGCWGFAGTAALGAKDIEKTADKALQIAKASSTTRREPVRLAQQEAFVDTYRSPFEKDPFAVGTDVKLSLLMELSKVLKKSRKVRTAEASMNFWKTNKLFVSSEGAQIEQEIVQSGAGYRVVAVDGSEAQTRSYPNSHGGDVASRGYEYIESMNLPFHAERIREEAVALLKARACPEGKRTVIICAPMMALQVHESCGHPTELDRVLGTEISLAGGSFMTPDKLNKLKYGSEIVNITADATIPGGLGSFGYDDEGVKAQRAPIIKDGVFVGYLTSRETAPVIGQRSNGTMRAQICNGIPLIRMTNHSLEPGTWTLADMIGDTDNGIFFDVNKSWSIDDKRLNFQFGCECAWEIKGGKLTRMFKNPLYTGITPEFWNSCDAIGNRDEWKVWGVPNCGKGEPMQIARVAHGAAPSRFRNVNVGVSK